MPLNFVFVLRSILWALSLKELKCGLTRGWAVILNWLWQQNLLFLCLRYWVCIKCFLLHDMLASHENLLMLYCCIPFLKALEMWNCLPPCYIILGCCPLLEISGGVLCLLCFNICPFFYFFAFIHRMFMGYTLSLLYDNLKK